MKPALLLVDIQKDYFSGGRMAVPGAVEASLAAKSLLDLFRDRHLDIIHIQHIAQRAGATFLLPGTNGIHFHENVRPLAGEQVIQKHYPSSFRDTELDTFLVSRQIKKLVISGMMSHMCIDATVRAAFDKGYDCLIAHDACAARGLEFQGVEVPAAHVHAAYMAALSAVYAKTATAEDIGRSIRRAS